MNCTEEEFYSYTYYLHTYCKEPYTDNVHQYVYQRLEDDVIHYLSVLLSPNMEIEFFGDIFHIKTYIKK